MVVADVIEEVARGGGKNNGEVVVVDVRGGVLVAAEEGKTDLVVVMTPQYGHDDTTRQHSGSFSSSDLLKRLGTKVHVFAPAVVGFPVDEAAVLGATGLDLVAWRTVETSGHDLGVFVSKLEP